MTPAKRFTVHALLVAGSTRAVIRGTQSLILCYVRTNTSRLAASGELLEKGELN